MQLAAYVEVVYIAVAMIHSSRSGLLADGLGNPAIAHRLGLSAKTVANHVSTILTKLQVADRTQAAFLARSKHKA